MKSASTNRKGEKSSDDRMMTRRRDRAEGSNKRAQDDGSATTKAKTTTTTTTKQASSTQATTLAGEPTDKRRASVCASGGRNVVKSLYDKIESIRGTISMANAERAELWIQRQNLQDLYHQIILRYLNR